MLISILKRDMINLYIPMIQLIYMVLAQKKTTTEKNPTSAQIPQQKKKDS